MVTLHYKTQINASKYKVWNTMLGAKTYPQWTKAFSPHSEFQGKWQQGSYIKFIDPSMGGTKAILETVKIYEKVSARHVAVLAKDGSEDVESEIAKKLYGTTEEYLLKEVHGITELTIKIRTHADFSQMFSDMWPKALDLLKELCERKAVKDRESVEHVEVTAEGDE